jgi:ABC-2 type transport system ATP-binding protein
MEEAEHLADRIVVLDTGKVVAEGTADDLKNRMGGDVLEIRINAPRELERAAALIGRLCHATPQIDSALGLISVPTKGGPRTLIDAGKALDDAGIVLDDLGIRRPSLDDVFLAITGRAASIPEGNLAQEEVLIGVRDR